MSRPYTTAALIQSVGIRTGIPVIQELFKASEQLLIADQVMLDWIVPMVLEHRKEHFRTYADSTVAATAVLDIPTEAMDRGLDNVTRVNASGVESPLDPIELNRELEARRSRYGPDASAVESATWGYYVAGDKLVLWPTYTTGDVIRQHYDRLPNRLCRSAAYTYNDGGTEAAEAVQVVSVNTSTGAITCTTGAVPATVTTSTPVCVVKGTPGFGLKIALSSNPTAVTTSVVTLGSDVAAVAAAGIVAGDWLALAGDSPVLQIPVEAHGILAQRLAVKLLESLEDTEALIAAKADLEQIETKYQRAFPLRVHEAPRDTHSTQRLADSVLGY